MLTRSTTFQIALASLISLASPAPAQDFAEKLISAGKLIVGTSQGGLAASTGPNGELVGYDIEYVQQLATDLHLTPEFVVIDFSGLLPGLIAGRFDIAAATMGRTKVRAESPDLISVPLMALTMSRS